MPKGNPKAAPFIKKTKNDIDERRLQKRK